MLLAVKGPLLCDTGHFMRLPHSACRARCDKCSGLSLSGLSLSNDVRQLNSALARLVWKTAVHNIELPGCWVLCWAVLAPEWAVGMLAGGRRGIGTNEERDQTLNQLLTELDGFEGRPGVLLLAATNRPEVSHGTASLSRLVKIGDFRTQLQVAQLCWKQLR